MWKYGLEGAPRSDSSGIFYLRARIARLEAFERWGSPRKINFEEVLGADEWARHWGNWHVIIGELRKAQELARELQERVAMHAD